MRTISALAVFVFVALAAEAEDFRLPDVGTLKIVAAGDWKIGGEDMGDRFELVIVPGNERTNAACRISINLNGPAELNSKTALRERVVEAIKPQLAKSVEKRVVPEQFYSRQGFGYHVTLTFPERVGKPLERGKFRLQTLGLVHLAPRLIASVTILADDVLSEEYQQLLGAVEGMEVVLTRK
jgi:hypothetical protein